MTPSFPRIGVSGLAGAVQSSVRLRPGARSTGARTVALELLALELLALESVRGCPPGAGTARVKLGRSCRGWCLSSTQRRHGLVRAPSRDSGTTTRRRPGARSGTAGDSGRRCGRRAARSIDEPADRILRVVRLAHAENAEVPRSYRPAAGRSRTPRDRLPRGTGRRWCRWRPHRTATRTRTSRRGSPRQARRQLVPQPVDVVIGPVRRDRMNRQPGPRGELACEQPVYERGIGLDLVGMHSGRAHSRHRGDDEFPASDRSTALYILPFIEGT